MATDTPDFIVRPYPPLRRLVQDAGWMARRRHMIHGLVEVDVTLPRQMVRDLKARTGERVSFTAFALACIGKAVAEDRRVHAVRDWRNRLIIFDDVDVLITVEIDAGAEKFPLVHTVRAVNLRTVRSIHDEIRAVQAQPADAAARSPLMSQIYRLPAPARHTLYRLALRQPHLWKEFAGTVGFTSVGMFGSGSGWGLGMPNHSLAIAFGGISTKPAIVGGRVLSREILNATLSFDHDIVDGAPAARFSHRFKELLEAGYGLDRFFGE